MKTVPGVNVVAHYAWAGEVQNIARIITLLAWATMIIIAVISVFQMVFMARARLAMFAPEIEILHTLGASDGFVAREFERQAFVLSLIGVLLGSIALLTVFGFVIHTLYPGLQLLGGVPLDQLSKLQEWREEIWGTAIVPAAILFLNTFMCRVAVMSALRRLV
jgi:cell division transport system permease protein